jgi:ferredoxin-NADP reductase
MVLTYTSKISLGDNAWAFRFTPNIALDWRAGQFVRIDLPHDRPDALGTTRRFTIAGIPYDNEVTIATRITSSSFKQTLNNLQPGSVLTLLDPPSGDFLWQPSPYAHVYLAQGIGITPFYAILKDRHTRGLPANAHLFYSSKETKTILFKSELYEWIQSDPTLHVNFQTMPLDPGHIAHTIPSLQKHLVYVSGPKLMLKLCMPPINLPIANLKQDNFPGYATSDY